MGYLIYLLVLSALLYGETPYTKQIKVVDLCTHLTEPLRVVALGIKGANYGDIEATKAVVACEESFKLYPKDYHIQFLLARAYSKVGRYEEGIKLLRNSCENGDIGGCTLLGGYYTQGLYAKYRNPKKGILLWQWSCSLGDPIACHNLAMIMEQKSDYIPKDMGTKQMYLLEACLSDLFPPACITYANHIYFKTIEYNKELYEYTSYIGCFSGDNVSCRLLETLLGDSNDTLGKQKVYYVMQASCNNGNAKGCEAVGRQYNKGGKTKLNHLLAYTKYDEGCNSGAERFSCWYAGKYKLKGAEGVVQDIPLGLRYLEKSCYIGMNSFACYDLAKFYINTPEIKYRDKSKAIRPLERACKIGNFRSNILGCKQGIEYCCREKKAYEEEKSRNK